MITCPKCHYARQPDDTAPDDECPSCGVIYAKARPRSRRKPEGPAISAKTAVVTVFFLIGVAGLLYARHAVHASRDTSTPTASRIATPSSQNTATVANSPFDGSVSQVERYLRSTLKDPDSLQVVKWYPVTKDLQGYAVRVIYRARNSLGGMVVEDRVFLLDRAGNVTP